MRKKRKAGGLTVNAIAGTHVVLLGLDLSDARRKGCLGFAIRREDHTEDERYWMSGMKTFRETDPGLGPGGQVSSRQHPFQSFQWADYSAKPGYEYTYTVIPLYNTPAQLKAGTGVSVRLKTEAEFGARHSVFFNRGAVASQEYARRFLNRPPNEVGEAAYRWLSRGLLKALTTFLQRADGPSYGLYGAVYEFQWPKALEAVKAAHASGARVRIIYDAIQGQSGPVAKNEKAIDAANIKSLCIPRTTGKIMHNKFFVLTKNDQPVAVWTGSTNLTENGIFGHSNCGHVIEDADVAAAFLAYWNELQGSPQRNEETAWMAQHNPAPPAPWSDDNTVIFSPRTGSKVLDWYAEIADSAKRALFMTFAFGMHRSFQTVYEQNDSVLRFALMEKEGNGAALPQARIDIGRIRRLPNVVVAVAKNIRLSSFDRWLQELPSLPGAHVKYVHTKYMLVDPLGKNPVVVTGSANFSKASTDTNNENMIVIRNDPRVADIYLGEFMRLFSHYAFREAVAIWREKHPDSDATWEPNYLSSNDDWQKDYFVAGSQRSIRRRYFSGA